MCKELQTPQQRTLGVYSHIQDTPTFTSQLICLEVDTGHVSSVVNKFIVKLLPSLPIYLWQAKVASHNQTVLRQHKYLPMPKSQPKKVRIQVSGLIQI